MKHETASVGWRRWVRAVIIGMIIGLALMGLMWAVFLWVPLLPRWGQVAILAPLLVLVEGTH